ncbi:pumilio-family RNA binding repeat protein-like protein [Mollisia scopiformis]|uniref:Pumilio-family RNA binding repeat protein-like protein n=1 Tax=Mollisia scopiformis TaxID=149040 RepID=A0A132B9N3_MOLSC|nr:pumilio-family RNA binding repeat protein-like protein [Mollisia scopiformis]KUJ09116.1 pumilio-family RNA binding repeat protein-like protein [Mollisia scopiformis]
MSASTGSPTMRRAAAGRSISQENAGSPDESLMARLDNTSASLKKSATALTSSKLGNQLANQTAPKMKFEHESSAAAEANPMDKLLAKLSEQQAVLANQREALKSSEDNIALARTLDYIQATSSSVPITSANESQNVSAAPTAPTTSPPSISGEDPAAPNAEEVARLKAELEFAKGKIALMDEELAQTRITKHTIDQAIGGASEADFPLSSQVDDRLNHLPPVVRPQIQRDNSWAAQDDARSDTSDALSATGFNRARAIWNAGGKPGFPGMQAPMPAPMPSFEQPSAALASAQWMSRGFGQPFVDAGMQYPAAPPMNAFRNDRMMPEPDLLMPQLPRRNQPGGRFNNRSSASSYPYASSNSSFDGFTPSTTPYGSVGGLAPGVSAMGGAMTMNMNASMGMYGGYQAQSIGTPLSPHAPEFTSSGSTWKSETGVTEGTTYMPTSEPLNYRRLLDRTVSCNWKYIVDKIVCNNDQQASIFLQQKLKVGTTEQKYEIVEAIVAQAYPLMVNRFGNFLVQRCFEHGTPEQVIKIADAIRGNTLNLSMDAFGCHVVQKAFDSVPEDYKAIMVHELLRRIPETVIHRYACHVWQKLFELRWTESPPQIMKFVNEALRGMWHEVALGETGSLVVQNIFENCLEEDKRPCIEEVLASIDIVAHGQFGNWCIQHICEHGAPADRSRAIDHVIRYASEYSMDQFASKVVEKCLKIGGPDFLSRYLDRVCEGRHDRPRIPLIDIASDQYGNYLIQYILTHSNPQHRELVASHIRKHMVSLRGSKFGSRVGMLCTNPAIQTRPGPGVGTAIGVPAPRMGPQPNPRFGGAYR